MQTMKKYYLTPHSRIVSLLPEKLIALSTPGAYDDEDDDERAPQSTRGFSWDNDNPGNNRSYWEE